MEMEMTRAYGVFRGVYVQHRNLQYSTLYTVQIYSRVTLQNGT